MPRYVRPSLEPRVEAAIDVFGASPLRIAIIAHLAAHDSATRREIEQGLGIETESVKAHLRDLERAGIITGNPPADRRPSGQRVRWTLQRDALLQEFNHLGAAIGIPDASSTD